MKASAIDWTDLDAHLPVLIAREVLHSATSNHRLCRWTTPSNGCVESTRVLTALVPSSVHPMANQPDRLLLFADDGSSRERFCYEDQTGSRAEVAELDACTAVCEALTLVSELAMSL
jgi:hypothetical protein